MSNTAPTFSNSSRRFFVVMTTDAENMGKRKAKGGKPKGVKGNEEKAKSGNGFCQSACNDFVGKQFYKVTIFKSIRNFRQAPLKKSN